MKITVARRDLHPALSAAARIVKARNTIPILATGLAIPYHPGRAAWGQRCRYWCPDAPRCEE